MTGPLLQVEGARQLRNALKEASNDLADLKDVHTKVATMVATAAAQNAPRRTGKLAFSHKPSATATRASVRVGGNVSGAGVAGVLKELGVSKGVPYAGAIHWGWPGNSKKLPKRIRGKIDRPWFIEPNPWIIETARNIEPAWVYLYQTELNEIIDRIGPETNRQAI